MKRIIAILFVFAAGCIDDPPSSPSSAQLIWIDAATRIDTIIKNAGNINGSLYYAIKNWQNYTDSSFSVGYRNVAGIKQDSVIVTLPNTINSKYYGPYQLGSNKANDTLQSQNFLDTLNNKTPSRLYILLK